MPTRSNDPWLRRKVAYPAALLAALAAIWPLAPCPRAGARADDKPAAPAASQSDFEENWKVIYIGKSRVGYLRTASAAKQNDGREVVSTDVEMAMVMSRFGQTVRLKQTTHTEETKDGELLSFTQEMQNPPAGTSRVSGLVAGHKLQLKTERAGETRTQEIPYDSSIKSSAYQDRLLRENPLKPGEERTLKTFDPEFGKVSTLALRAGERQMVKLLGGKERKLLKVSIRTSAAPGIVLDDYLDEKGESHLSATTMLGLVMAMYTVPKDEALKSLTGEEVDLAIASLVKTRTIDRPRETQRVVYRITIPGEDPAKFLATGSTQEIRPFGPNAVDLTVHSGKPPATGKTPDE